MRGNNLGQSGDPLPGACFGRAGNYSPVSYKAPRRVAHAGLETDIRHPKLVIEQTLVPFNVTCPALVSALRNK